jgi:hypothetical protein
MDIPMLDEHEWGEILPRLMSGIEQIKRYRVDDNVSLAEARRAIDESENGALTRYFEITGFRETNTNALWHHRLSLFGPRCGVCGKPLRTPRARMCVACGTPRSESD